MGCCLVPEVCVLWCYGRWSSELAGERHFALGHVSGYYHCFGEILKKQRIHVNVKKCWTLLRFRKFFSLQIHPQQTTGVLVRLGLHNKGPQMGGEDVLKQQKLAVSQFQRIQSLSTRCWQGGFPLRPLSWAYRWPSPPHILTTLCVFVS